MSERRPIGRTTHCLSDAEAALSAAVAQNRGSSIVGQVVEGYLIVRLLGVGSTSGVYLGVHLESGRSSAVKILADQLVDDRHRVRRLAAEAEILKGLRHPNIISVEGFFETAEPHRVGVVMEFVEGPSLAELGVGRLSFEQTMAVALQVVDALGAAHAHGIVHRDLKPSNVLLTEDPRKSGRVAPRAKIVDFGVAKMAGEAIGHQPATGVMIGTPAYMAPEQVVGSPPPSEATDVYAVAELVYEMLAGRRAYVSSNVDAVIRAKLSGAPPELELPADHPGIALLPLLRDCFAMHAADRPALASLAEGLRTHAPEKVLKALGLPLVPRIAPQVTTQVETMVTGRPAEDTERVFVVADASDTVVAEPPRAAVMTEISERKL